MTSSNKRMNLMDGDQSAKRVKKECSYGEKCYRLNPAHFREYSHAHLESILDKYSGEGEYPVPDSLSLQRSMIRDQLDVIVEKQLYQPKQMKQEKDNTHQNQSRDRSQSNSSKIEIKNSQSQSLAEGTRSREGEDLKSNTVQSDVCGNRTSSCDKLHVGSSSREADVKSVNTGTARNREKSKSPTHTLAHTARPKEVYHPVVEPVRRAEQYLSVVLPRGRAADKLAASAPYHLFYTTIAAEPRTHRQRYSITFQEILDRSLGELKSSLQINFMVDITWLMAHYYFAGYSGKNLTVLYGDDSMPDLKGISKRNPRVDAHYIAMPTPFGKHHTKMMVLCYEDGSLRVVVSTANLYEDDWENRTQGLWLSPRCPELPQEAMPFEGESPTMFKRSLLKYLNHYHLPQLAYYVERVKRCDFSHINVFLVASVPGSHFDTEWGLARAGALLRQHCALPAGERARWPLLAQASSIGSYGKEPQLWLTGDFLHHFTKIKDQPQTLSTPPELKLIYPSLENVRQSHDGLLGGGCLPYGASAHAKQPWLNSFLHQWRATSSHRDKAMPHLKSYTRVSPDGKRAAFYLVTSGNVSKAAWGAVNKGDRALRLLSYEAGVLLLPRHVINEDFFPLEEGAQNRLVIPYDIPPTKYTSDMSPWVMDYLR